MADKKLSALTALGAAPATNDLIYIDDVSASASKSMTVANLFTSPTITTPTVATSLTGSYLTASEVLITDASKNIVSAPVATYPSLTELSYVKGVTSALQTQINAKGAGTVTDVSVTTANGVSGSVATSTTTPAITLTLGAITPTTVNGNTITTGTGTLTLAASKTLTANNTLTLAGTDSTTMTFPSTSATIARTDAANTFTGVQTMTSPVINTSLELGHATENTLTASSGVLSIEGAVIPTISSTNTLTNKRINPRLVTAASYTTDTGTSLDVSTCDQFEVTAQAGALLFNAPGGTPLGGQKLIIRIKDNGTARALTWNAVFRAMGTALPSTTVLSKTLYLGFFYNSTDTKWDLVASAQEA